MSVTIDWGVLGAVFLVSFGAAVGVIVLFSLGVSALAAPGLDPTSAPDKTGQETATRPAAIDCATAVVRCLGAQHTWKAGE